MKIVYIKLKGYIGIYNGLGLDEIEIDMSNSTHKIVLLTGINGCGKSTLLKAMSVLPDNSSDFIPGVAAEKILRIVDENNIYDIDITSPIMKSGSRAVTKASLIKNGVELNPNGNIGSYKEIVFQEFELDSNFITLCRLSSDDRGLADKTPAERKKYMSFIVDSLDTYNNLYKSLNKKSSIFKSYVNNLHTKIQNIGDEEMLRSQLSGLEYKRNTIKSNINTNNEAIIEKETLLRMNDPNGDLQTQYENANKTVKETLSISKDSNDRFMRQCNLIKVDSDLEVIKKSIEEQNNLLEEYKKNNEEANRKKLTYIEKRQSISTDIESKKMRIDDLSKDIDPKLSLLQKDLKDRINQELKALVDIGVRDPDNTSKEELTYIFDTIHIILNQIDDFYYELDDSMIKSVLEFTDEMITNIEASIESKQKELEKNERLTKEYQSDQNTLSALLLRPKDCKINTCPFIRTAYGLKSKKYAGKDISVLSRMAGIEQAIILTDLNKLTEEYQRLTEVRSKRVKLDNIRDLISRNSTLLIKTHTGKNLVENFESRISTLQTFNDCKDMKDITDNINAIGFYKQDTASLRTVESELLKQANSEKLVEELSKDLSSLQEQLNVVVEDINSMSRYIEKMDITIKNIDIRLESLNRALELGNKATEDYNTYNESVTVLNDITSKSKASIETLAEITRLKSELEVSNSQLSTIEEQISKTNGLLIMLDSYKQEYEKYSSQYNTVEVLKKHCSPTSGIQTLFISVYMNKTLDLANQVLGMIFGGQYHLLDYVINANEFKIPFIGNGMRVDDISSGSTSQVCMMGMVMNLVLKYQASPRYNIACLDEIDGGLDTRNRMEFVNVLYKLVDILNIDQLFIISHSLELELSNVDIIKLKAYSDFGESTSTDGNVLYDFNLLKH